jgi:iron complex outermembrane receptor protein
MAGGTYARNQLEYFSAFGSKDPATGDDLGGIYRVESPQFGDPYRVRIRQISAGYLQGKVDLASHLTVTVGSRYDWYSDFGESINPRAAAVWATPWKSFVKLTYGHAFRAPQIFEVGLSKPSGLKPEKVRTVEVSYVQRIFGVAEVTADCFQQKLENLIDYDAEGWSSRSRRTTSTERD